MPSVSEKLIMVVVGESRESRQDLSRKVGMMSSEQVVFDELSMMVRTSSAEAGVKLARQVGVKVFGSCGGAGFEGKEAVNFVILSLKKRRNDEASEVGDEALGNVLGQERDSKELRVDQSFFG